VTEGPATADAARAGYFSLRGGNEAKHSLVWTRSQSRVCNLASPTLGGNENA